MGGEGCGPGCRPVEGEGLQPLQGHNGLFWRETSSRQALGSPFPGGVPHPAISPISSDPQKLPPLLQAVPPATADPQIDLHRSGLISFLSSCLALCRNLRKAWSPGRGSDPLQGSGTISFSSSFPLPQARPPSRQWGSWYSDPAVNWACLKTAFIKSEHTTSHSQNVSMF